MAKVGVRFPNPDLHLLPLAHAAPDIGFLPAGCTVTRYSVVPCAQGSGVLSVAGPSAVSRILIGPPSTVQVTPGHGVSARTARSISSAVITWGSTKPSAFTNFLQ